MRPLESGHFSKVCSCPVQNCLFLISCGTFLDGNLLILVDQHAAHERIRLEQLIAGEDSDGLRKKDNH